MEECLAYALRRGFTLGTASNVDRPGVLVDAGQSARKKASLLDRMAGRILLEQLRPGDQIIVTAPHRMFRNLREAAIQLHKWSQQGVSVHFTSMDVDLSSANGKLLLHVLLAASQWESDIRSQRQHERNAWRKMQGTAKEKEAAKKRIDQPAPMKASTLFTQLWINLRTVKEPERVPGIVRAYTRVSGSRQNIQVSQEALQELCDSHPELRGRPVIWYLDHGYSAFKTRFADRPAARQLLQEMKPGDIVVSLRADRVIRSISDAGRVLNAIQDRGGHLFLADCGMRTDTAMGSMLFSVLSFVAQLESENIRRSTEMGKRSRWIVTGVPEDQVTEPFRKPVSEPKRGLSGRTKGSPTACLQHLIPPELVTRTFRRFVEILDSGASQVPYARDKSRIMPGFLRASAMAEKELAREVELPPGFRKVRCRVVNGKCKTWPEFWTTEKAIQEIREHYPDGERQRAAIELLDQMDPSTNYSGLIGWKWLTNSKYLQKIHRQISAYRGEIGKIDLSDYLRLQGDQDALSSIERLLSLLGQ